MISWQADDLFDDPFPHQYLLQVANGPVAGADWADVGLLALNAYYLVDDEQRNYGVVQDWYYRVVLTTPKQIYYSPPISAVKGLNFRDWRLARDIVRKERLRAGRYTALTGKFFKRRRSGPPCTRCLEPLSGTPTDSHCSVCYGTRFVGGFFAGEAATLELNPDAALEHLDTDASGQTKPVVVPDCRMLGDPTPDTQDLFVDSVSDRRFVFHEVKRSALIRGFPLVCEVTVRLADASDIIYKLPIS